MKAYVKNIRAIWPSIFFALLTSHVVQAHVPDTHPKS
jgi:hypothetical protein